MGAEELLTLLKERGALSDSPVLPLSTDHSITQEDTDEA